MKPLLDHIQRQQDAAIALCGVLEAAGVLNMRGDHKDLVGTLIVAANDLAAALNRNLDTVRLPEGGDA